MYGESFFFGEGAIEGRGLASAVGGAVTSPTPPLEPLLPITFIFKT